MPSNDDQMLFLGRTNFRDVRQRFGIRREDRRYHTYIIGATGTGKTTLLENLIYQDVLNGEGVAVLDPHGDMVRRLASRIPEFRKRDLVYFNVPDPKCPYGFNPVESVAPDRRALAAEGVLESFKKIWDTTWGPRMEHFLRNTLLTLLDQPKATLADVSRILHDPAYRAQALTHVTNPEVLKFWRLEFASYQMRFRAEAVAPILNKVGAFLIDPNLQRIFTRTENTLDIRKLMDEKKILLVNLAKGVLGPTNSSLLGAMLVSRFGVAALSRADQPALARQDFYLYLDEFQNFTTLSTADILSEVRKYGLAMILSHQYLTQLDEQVRDAILGNVGNIISFRVGAKDADVLEKVFYPEFSSDDLIHLPNYSMYLRLMVNGEVVKPFSANTLTPLIAEQIVSWLSRLGGYAVRFASSVFRWWIEP